MIYVAAPYWHFKAEVREWRVQETALFAAWLASEPNNYVYAPTVFGHSMVSRVPGPIMNEQYWRDFGLVMLRHARRLAVLRLPEWEASKGLKREIEAAKQWKIPTQHYCKNLIGWYEVVEEDSK